MTLSRKNTGTHFPRSVFMKKKPGASWVENCKAKCPKGDVHATYKSELYFPVDALYSPTHSFIHSRMHACTQETLAENYSSNRHYSEQWGYSHGPNRNSCLTGLLPLSRPSGDHLKSPRRSREPPNTMP